MIKAVIFDMFETLVTLSHAKRYMGEEISRDLNIDEPKFREIWNPSDYDRACGVRTFEDVVKEIMEVNDCYNKDLFDLVVRKRIESKEESFRCVRPDVYDMLEGLKKKGVKIALVSNSFFEEYDIIKNHPLYQYFDVTCISCVEGIKKPDERIFNLCLERLQLQPEDCLYVGDGGTNELKIAEKLGMHPVQALWYLKEGTGQPTGRLLEFEGAAEPMDIVRDYFQAFNPYLPSYEYIPDGEPRVFDKRLYIYGSHDSFNGKVYCQNDYVCWSAPEDDLTNWRYEGVIFKKTQDPRNKDGAHALWAPDVCKGLDGKYYLYYCLDFLKEIGVAVASKPEGPYEFLDFVRWPDGRILGTGDDTRQFDPGIFIDDDERIYLFSGNSPRYADMPNPDKNSQKMELERDMITIKSAPVENLPIITKAPGTEYEKHPFFEASSVRKINGKYYFIYSSTWMHELCWAVSDTPLGEYHYGGVLVSNADIGIDGNTEALNYRGNTHGSVAFVNGKWYVFYHRQTNRHFFSRQACAEEIYFDGEAFHQAEITSCGLNNGPLADKGIYEARIACHLYSKDGTTESLYEQQNENHPAFTQDGPDREENPNQYVANMRDGATAGYKYFMFKEAVRMDVTTRGTGNGKFVVRDGRGGNIVSEIQLSPSAEWESFGGKLTVETGKHSLYFTYEGDGYVDFKSFRLI